MEEKRCYGCMKPKISSPVCEHCGFDEAAQNAAHQLPMGTVLKEQYLIGRVLGQGGFGITYLGWDLYLEIPVAIKEYFPNGLVMRENTLSNEVASCGGDASARFANNKERFFREAKMLARFSQMPEIVQVKNFFLTNNTAYIVMEYVEGITLKQHVKNKGGKLSVEETFSILGPVMRALEKVHKSGLVHRDISPDNIMMLPEGGAKLLDFGAVRDVGAIVAGQAMTSSTESILKPGYAPIEQYQKRGSLGPWTDIYALCGTIYYCLTGSAPIDAPERVMEDPELHLETLVPTLPAYRRHALEQGLALRAEERIGSMAELNKALFPEKDEETPQTPAEAPARMTEVRQESPVVTQSKPRTQAKPRTETAPKQKEIPQAVREAKNKKKSKLPLILAACAVIAAAALLIPKMIGPKEETPAVTEDQTLSGQCGDGLSWSLDGTTLKVEGSGGIWDYAAEAAPWQEEAGQITEVKLSGSITRIGYGAFRNLSNLTRAELPDSLQEIGEDAFRGTGLAEIRIPDSVTVIGPRAFMETPLKKVTFGAGMESIGTQAFALCPQLETAEFSSNPIMLEHWDERIFTADEARNAPEKLTVYAKHGSYPWAYAAHYGINYALTGTLPTLGSGSCGQKMTWTLYEGGVFVLDGSGNMTEYAKTEKQGWTVEDYRNAMPWGQVYDQIKLLYIGDQINAIANRSFYGCESLQYLYYDTTRNNEGFYNDHGLFGFEALAYSGLTQLEVPAFSEVPGSLVGCKDLEFLKVNYQPHGREIFWGGALAGCESLQVLDVNWSCDISRWIENATIFSDTADPSAIPATLTVKCGPSTLLEAFCQDNGVSFEANINGYTADESGNCGEHVKWMLDKDQNTLVLYGDYDVRHNNAKADTWDFDNARPEFYAYKDEIEHIFITNEVTSLGRCIFQDLTALETVDTMSNVRNGWGDGDLKMSNYSQIKRIGDRAFAGCSALKWIEIPYNAENLGRELFLDCMSLEEVYYLSGGHSLPDGALAGCHSLNKLYVDGYANFSKNVFKAQGREEDHDYTLHVVVHCTKGLAAESRAKELGLKTEYIENK